MENYTNRASSTLTASINDSVGSLAVDDASLFPSSGNFRVIVDDELMIVTAVSGSTFTVTRGAEGSTAASHDSGVVVGHIITAGSIQAIRADQTGLSLTDGFEGRLSLGGNVRKGTTSAWETYTELTPLSQVPGDAGSWSWLNQGSGSTLDVLPSGAYKLTAPHSATGDAWTPVAYEVTFSGVAGVEASFESFVLRDGSNQFYGIYLRDSSSGRIVFYRFDRQNTGYVSKTAFNTGSNLASTSFRVYALSKLSHAKITYSSNQVRVFSSNDGETWYNPHKDGANLHFATSSFTPNRAGIFVNVPASGAGISSMTVHSFKVY
jgi:hypothetical protein